MNGIARLKKQHKLILRECRGRGNSDALNFGSVLLLFFGTRHHNRARVVVG